MKYAVEDYRFLVAFSYQMLFLAKYVITFFLNNARDYVFGKFFKI